MTSLLYLERAGWLSNYVQTKNNSPAAQEKSRDIIPWLCYHYWSCHYWASSDDWLWMVLRVLETVEIHCHYHFPWSLSNFLPYRGADFHDYHHRLLYSKSGKIFGTDTGYRNLKALKKTGVEDDGEAMYNGKEM
ncbi:hypothetical protein M0R45_025777 [Rubus argutus]|uniref:Fatty acid hydroxylase domain-containing protein n=1 Tax=Rubus argutus TaxID=59490 RepID=A0AAW1WX96_RUBAR